MAHAGQIVRFGKDHDAVCRLTKECPRYHGGWHAILFSGDEGVVTGTEISPASADDILRFQANETSKREDRETRTIFDREFADRG